MCMSSSCGEEARASPTRMGLPRRIQGMEQEVCQLLLAALGQKNQGKWQCVAVLAKKWQKKATEFNAGGFLRGLVA
jgi:hypothetical protein